MRHEATRQLFRYWNAIRKERASPERDDIDPGAIREVLPDTFLLAARPDGSFRIRLSGTRYDALWLAGQKGHDFRDAWGEDRHSLAAALWTVMDGASPVVLGTKALPPGRTPVEAEGLLLPLRHHGKTHSLILGALTLAQPPTWIGLIPIERLRLTSLRVVTPASVSLPVVAMPAASGRPSPVSKRGHLTVYAGGR